MSNVKPVPDSSSIVIPMLVCRDVAAEIDFCKTTFGAVELGRRPGPDGTVVHGLLTIGGAMIIIEGEWPTLASRAPQPDASSPVVIFAFRPVDHIPPVAREECVGPVAIKQLRLMPEPGGGFGTSGSAHLRLDTVRCCRPRRLPAVRQ